MSRHFAAALAAFLLSWFAPAGDANAQSVANGRTLYTNYCRSCHGSLPGSPNSVLNGASETNLVNTISTSPNMRQLYPIIESIPNGWSDLAAYIASYVPPTSTPPTCTLSSSNTTPGIGTSITLTSACSGSPTSYSWTGCASTGSTCTKTESSTGTRTYSVTASNAAGASSPASVQVNWQATAGPPTPSPTPPPTPTPTPVPPPPTSQVVEYYHAAFGHYFITNIAGEISALDSGKFAGWARTGRSFSAYASNNGYVTGVCRFFTVAFPPKSSHFYTSNTAECNDVRNNNRDWTFEAEGFYVQQADPATGGCPTGFQAVYRLYNNGQSGAPNHRYTTDPAVRVDMMGKGWIPEGFGPEGVGFCAPY